MPNPRTPRLPRAPGRRRNGSSSAELSRSSILTLLRNAGGPLPLEDIGAQLRVRDEPSLQVLDARLGAMADEGALIRNRRGHYAAVERMDLTRGRVAAHRDGYGFVIPEDGGQDLYLAPREMRSLLHGDRVLVRVRGIDRRGLSEAALVEIIERNNEQVVGRFFKEGGVGFVIPDNKRRHQNVVIPGSGNANARDGDIVVAQITEPPTERSQPIGKVVEVLGEHMAPGLEIDVAIRSHGLPHQWSEEVVRQAEGIALDPSFDDSGERENLRELSFVTIDGADAKDFDDAVYCEPSDKGWTLWVAIADVCAYVPKDSPLDEEARRRSTSVYFPGRVIPMLPERLSNGVCSLNPGVDRLVLACRMSIDANGRIRRSSFTEAVIHSRARLTYDEVADAIVDLEEDSRTRLGELTRPLDDLYALFRVLKRARRRRGALEIETVEPRIVFGVGERTQRIDRIEGVVRNTAHEIIEECMIAANVSAARFLTRHKLPALFRIHEAPSDEKCAELRLFLGEIGLPFTDAAKPSPSEYARVLESAVGRPDAHLVQTLILRSLKQAAYRPKNIGHFGIALECYAHFTSPIRRYPDLLLHRAIRHRLRGGRAADAPYSPEEMVGLGEHTSMAERRDEEAVRDAISWLKCEYMMDKVGEQFSGIVSAVTSFGVFVELKDVLVDGLVHVSSLGDDFYHFDPVRHRLEGERTAKTYRLAQPLTVRVTRVNLDDRKIDFELAEPSSGPFRPRRSARRRQSQSRAGRRKARRSGA